MNEIRIFEKAGFENIRVCGTSDEPLFCLADVCRNMGLQPASVKNRLDPKGVISINTPTNGGAQDIIFISEKNLYKSIMRSDKEKAVKFQDWVCGEVVPSIRKTGKYELTEKTPQQEALATFDEKVRFIEWSANFLGVNDAGKLLMARKLAEEYGTQQYLPDYVTSKGQTHSATYLLKAHNCNISANVFNISCHSFGLIKKMERKGKGGTIHNWWALTDEGMEYGENKVSDKCPLQTQIHWYDDRFTEVLDIIRCKYDRLEDKIN